MKKGWFKIAIILVLIVIVVMAIYFGSRGNGENIISRLLNNGNQKEEIKKPDDTVSGVYVYKTMLDKTYTISYSCHVSSLDKYIVIINDDYFVYNSTCLGTFYENKGKKSELNIKMNETTKLNEIVYGDKTYTKDNLIKEFIPTTTKEQMDNISTVDFSNLKFIIKNTEIPGHYYILDTQINKATSRFSLTVNYTSDIPILRIHYQDTIKYSLYIYDVDNLPRFYALNNNIAVIEKQGERENVKILDDSTSSLVAYNSDNEFPITIDNKIVLDSNDKTMISYQDSDKSFYMLVTKNSTFCTEESNNPNGIAYYKYKIEYNYKVKKWQMNFVSIAYNKDGCSEVKSMMGE